MNWNLSRRPGLDSVFGGLGAVREDLVGCLPDGQEGQG